MKIYSNRFATIIAAIFLSATVLAGPIQIQPEDESEFVTLKRSEVKEIVNRIIEAQVQFRMLENVIEILQKRIERLQASTNCV